MQAMMTMKKIDIATIEAAQGALIQSAPCLIARLKVHLATRWR